jgi:hypothetical protein
MHKLRVIFKSLPYEVSELLQVTLSHWILSWLKQIDIIILAQSFRRRKMLETFLWDGNSSTDRDVGRRNIPVRFDWSPSRRTEVTQWSVHVGHNGVYSKILGKNIFRSFEYYFQFLHIINNHD